MFAVWNGVHPILCSNNLIRISNLGFDGKFYLILYEELTFEYGTLGEENPFRNLFGVIHVGDLRKSESKFLTSEILFEAIYSH